MNPEVDTYFVDGCGRCELGGTPDCKVNSWQKEMRELRLIILDCDLTEEVKWGVPCYTYQGGNVFTMSALKDYCAIGFFKGALINDVHNILEKPGKNTQAARLIKFTSIDQIVEMEHQLRAYIQEAIDIEKAGLKVPMKKNPEPIPEELQDKLDNDPIFQEAFDALTPGRQRGYILHFSGAKQAKTRVSRIEKCTPKIMEGKGLHDW
ncbi:MAG: YdeI/OmpD-associated family protein [Balneola sp.]